MGQQSTIAKPHIYVMLNQMGINEGIKKFRAKRNHILLKELNQLHERSTLLPKKKEEMSYDKRRKALRYLMFLKEKRDGIIKLEDVLREGASMSILPRLTPAHPPFHLRR